MNRLYKYLLISILAMFLSACGGGGGSSSTDNSETPSPDESNTTQIILCSETTNIQEYTLLKEDDTIVKNTEDTVVSIYHNSDGDKLVCVESGSASVQESL